MPPDHRQNSVPLARRHRLPNVAGNLFPSPRLVRRLFRPRYQQIQPSHEFFSPIVPSEQSYQPTIRNGNHCFIRLYRTKWIVCTLRLLRPCRALNRDTTLGRPTSPIPTPMTYSASGVVFYSMGAPPMKLAPPSTKRV